MKTIRYISLGLIFAMGLAVALITSCVKQNQEGSDSSFQKQMLKEPCGCQTDAGCDPAPVVEAWTKAQYDAFGVAYKGSAKVEIAPGITLEKIKANDHELVFDDADACTITLAVKNGNIYQAYTFNTQCADNYIFSGKDVSGVKYGAYTCAPCDCQDEIIACTQAYYPTGDVDVLHYAGPNHRERDDNTNYVNKHTAIHSSIATDGGTSYISRFYLNFDLNDFYHTKNTQIKNTFLYLYGDNIEGHWSNTVTENRHVFNRVVDDWEDTTITWSNQPNVDETTNVITDHIVGTIDDQSTENYVFDLGSILLENGKLRDDFKGISCRPYQEDINDYYRRFSFANRRFGDEALFPTLKVEYEIPLEIEFKENVFGVTDNEDLELLFDNVQYVWTINGKEYTGKSINLESIDEQYAVRLLIVITNNIGEITEYTISKTF